MVTADDPTLGLRDAWNRKLYLWWDHYNQDYLQDALSRPQIRVGDSGGLGSWTGDRRILTISAEHIGRDPWHSVMETLRHEMAHQYAHEVLEADSEGPHGQAFVQACEKLRCSPRATASGRDLEQPAQAPPHAEDGILRRLKKLLSLSSSPNEHEAEVAMQKARHLLMKYNIDLVEADQERRFERRTLGSLKGRHTSAEIWLAAILNEFFFVEVLWAHSYEAVRNRVGTILEVYGTPQNLEMAEYVFAYLTNLPPMLWNAYRKESGLTSNRERQRYFAGVLEGFHRKLKEQSRTLVESQTLVWKGDGQLRSFYRHINPRVTTRYGRGVTQTQAYQDGLVDGQQVTINKPVSESSSGEQRQLTG